MKYHCTRDIRENKSSSEAILKGLADNGGLYVPEEKPEITRDDLSTLAGMSYNERAKFILSRFLTDFTEEELDRCVDGAYNEQSFDTPEIAPLHRLNDHEYVLELWHGPTCAFKDMALQILPYFLTASMKKTGVDQTVVILVATSGDTGKAALEGFCDVDGTKIIVYYPEEGVSRIQKLQMITQSGQNVGVCAVKGNFDDAQTGVKMIFTDDAYKKKLLDAGFVFSSANSINWGRLVPQIVYYFSAYADLLKKGALAVGEPMIVVVPTGNFGNILAAYYAMGMGLPVKKLICASNCNHVLTDFIRTGVYDRQRPFHTTYSPSMDILISSNLERFLFDISGGDDQKVAAWMNELRTNGKYEIDDALKRKMQAVLWGGYCDDTDTVSTIAATNEKYRYVIDPHTAVAQNVYEQYLAETGDMTVTVVASTASPFKFNRCVLSAICGEDGIRSEDEFELLEMLREKSGMSIPKSLEELKTKEHRFTSSIAKTELKAYIDQVLGLE